ncbi:hypothetical protein [Streptomyces sp. 8N706]|uniref:hypothetical protein n=1 Tax=Streptomyces sp. 8N706 TaxID=3457416 RepID=UPI003FD5BA25
MTAGGVSNTKELTMTYTDMEVLEEEVDQSKILRTTADYTIGGQSVRSTTESYRHAWPNRTNGVRIFRLGGWPEMRPDSKVWIAATQALVLGDGTAGGHLGDAVFTVHNIVPENGQVRFRLNIAWGEPLPVITDFWVIHFT